MKKIAFYLFISVLIFAPMAFGTVETGSYLIMELLVCTSAILLFLSSGTKKNPRVSFYRIPGIWPFILVNAFLLLQIIPLPGSLVKILSPSTYSIYDVLAELTGSIGWISLSIYPRATLMDFLRFSTYLLFYIIAVQFFTDRHLLKKTIAIVASFAAVLSLIAIIEFVTESLNYPLAHNKIFWLRELSQGGTPMGPYVNRNHYAGLMEMIFPLVLAMFLVYRPVMTNVSFQKRVADFFNHKRVNLHLFYGTTAILVATSILLSLSRGGILSLSVSMIIFSIILILKANQKKAGLFIGAIVLIVLFLTGTSGWDAIFKRFENLKTQSGLIYDSRLIIWEDSINIIRDFPIFGTGAGTFEKIYPLYRSVPGKDILEHAHNDYLEFLSTGGIILPALMGWCLFSLLYPAVRSFIRRRDSYSVLLFTGCLTSVSAILLHSLVDFNMQVGANGLYFFLVLALAVSAAHTRMRYGLGATYLKASPRSPYSALIPVICLTMGVIYFHGGAMTSQYLLKDFGNVSLTPETDPEKLMKINKAAASAAALDILNPEYRNIRAKTAALMLKKPEADNQFAASVRLSPNNSRYLMDAASYVHQQKNYDLAEKLYLINIQYNKNNMAAYLKYAAMLFEKNQPEQSLDILKRAISADVGVTESCLALMVLNHIEDDQLSFALPDRVAPYLALGDFFNSLGEKQKAETAYVRGLEFLPNETQIGKNLFLKVYNFYQRNQQHENALHIILRAIDYFPDDHGLHRIAGRLYQKLGIEYRAEEEFRKARLIKQNTTF